MSERIPVDFHSWATRPGRLALDTLALVDFSEPNLLPQLLAADVTELDQFPFGVIGFDREGIVRRYNTWESKAAGLSQSRVIGQPLFTSVAPCMNNYLVAQAFDDAAATGETLDRTLPYVLTLRMRPTKVQLRLLASASDELRYVLIQRSS